MRTDLQGTDEFVEALRAVGARAYHDKHPFHVAMNAGQLTPEAIQIWVANRYCYQRAIPIKDAAILSNCPLREVRRTWLHRIVDHDGTAEGEGGIEAWLQLGQACGLDRETMIGETQVIPAVRFAVDAYVTFARTQPWAVAIASSLTELFAPDLMRSRIEAFERHYTWIDVSGLEYFKRRVSQARRDSDEALAIAIAHCNTPALQQAAIKALTFKCDVLWAILDGIHHAAYPQSDS